MFVAIACSCKHSYTIKNEGTVVGIRAVNKDGYHYLVDVKDADATYRKASVKIFTNVKYNIGDTIYITKR